VLPTPFDVRIASARTLPPAVRELTFERLDGQPMVFEPGQWVNLLLSLGETGDTKRSYSIASPPDGSPRFDVAVTHVQGGPGSTWLHAVAPGEELTAVGPQGFFTRSAASAPPSLMVATGTGVTPMRSMVRAALAAGSRAPTWILLGVRHEEDAPYADEFSALAASHPFLRFETTLSQPRSDWRGRRCYVQAHVPELWRALAAEGGGTPHAYVCGLERMVGSVRELLRKDLGLPRQQVHGERYD
jgi:CDP-4-dehydro-6-deoxyglucose reductase